MYQTIERPSNWGLHPRRFGNTLTKMISWQRFFERASEQMIVPAVLQEDLRGLLKSMRTLEDFEAGRILCSVCGVVMTIENVQAIVPKSDGHHVWVCNNPSCVHIWSTQKAVN